MVALGIDLGTTNSCMGIVRNDKVELVSNHLGDRITPSVVGFIRDQIIIGNISLIERVKFSENVIYEVKRLIGRSYTNTAVKKMREDVPFAILNKDGKVAISITRNGDSSVFTPEEISAKILLYLKENAEKFLDEKLSDVVIAVPTYFDDSQRRATRDAGKIAGFNRVALIDEPTAAAIQYGIENKISDGRIILVFDFGGGTFDVSVIKYDNNCYEVLAIDGDTHLGGIDINNALFQYINGSITHLENKRDIVRLRHKIEDIKVELSTKKESYIDLFDEEVTMKRSTFNEITEGIIMRAITTVKNCLKKLGNSISRDDIDVLLVGGSSRIHRIEELLQAEFGKITKQNINKDEAVAAGAAIWAAKLYDNKYKELNITKICPHSLGVEVDIGKMSFLIKQFTKFPVAATKRYKTADEKQTDITIRIYSGEDECVYNNTFLGELSVSKIASGPNGCILTETFAIDDDGILTVTASDGSGTSKAMSILLDTGNLTEVDIEKYRKRCLEK